MRSDNDGVTQPYRTYLLNEKTVMSDDLRGLLCEDNFKDEQFYVDFLADIHGQIQAKMG